MVIHENTNDYWCLLYGGICGQMLLCHVRHSVTLLLETTSYCAVPNGQQSVLTQNVISERTVYRKPHIIFISSDLLPIGSEMVKIIYIVSNIQLFFRFNALVPCHNVCVRRSILTLFHIH
jgi:hypothetical protein